MIVAVGNVNGKTRNGFSTKSDSVGSVKKFVLNEQVQ